MYRQSRLRQVALKLSNPCEDNEEHWIELTDEGSMFIDARDATLPLVGRS